LAIAFAGKRISGSPTRGTNCNQKPFNPNLPMNNDLLEKQVRQRHVTARHHRISPTTIVGVPPEADEETSTEDSRLRESDAPKRVILLVTHDIKLDHGLRSAAKTEGYIILRVESLADALRTVRAGCAHIALLDVDMAAESGWDTADGLMQNPNCPPVILMTGRTGQFEMRMAIEGGVLLDKTSDPVCILQAVNKIIETPASAVEERNAIQRVLIRWLRPLHWPSRPISTCRYWGINE
jgi:CheY-like chemotaxis protein